MAFWGGVWLFFGGGCVWLFWGGEGCLAFWERGVWLFGRGGASGFIFLVFGFLNFLVAATIPREDPRERKDRNVERERGKKREIILGRQPFGPPTLRAPHSDSSPLSPQAFASPPLLPETPPRPPGDRERWRERGGRQIESESERV